MTPLSVNTKVTPIYEHGNITIAFYDNVNPETQHGQTRLLVFDNNRYAYSYNADSESCFVRNDLLRCVSNFEQSPYYDVKISDILAKKDVVIGGYDAKAYATRAFRRSRIKAH